MLVGTCRQPVASYCSRSTLKRSMRAALELWCQAMAAWGREAAAAGLRFSHFVSMEHVARLRTRDPGAYEELACSLRSLLSAKCRIYPHNHCVFDPVTGEFPGESERMAAADSGIPAAGQHVLRRRASPQPQPGLVARSCDGRVRSAPRRTRSWRRRRRARSGQVDGITDRRPTRCRRTSRRWRLADTGLTRVTPPARSEIARGGSERLSERTSTASRGVDRARAILVVDVRRAAHLPSRHGRARLG